MKAFIDENKELLITAETLEEGALLDEWKNKNPRTSNVQRKLNEGVVALTLRFENGHQ